MKQTTCVCPLLSFKCPHPRADGSGAWRCRRFGTRSSRSADGSPAAGTERSSPRPLSLRRNRSTSLRSAWAKSEHGKTIDFSGSTFLEGSLFFGDSEGERKNGELDGNRKMIYLGSCRNQNRTTVALLLRLL